MVCLLLLSLGGCGYGYSRGQSVLPEDKRKLAIVEIINPAPLSWLEPRLRSLIRDEVTRRGIATWAAPDKADALMTIDIERYYRRSSVTGQDEETLLSTATISFEATIRSAVDRSVIWRSGKITRKWQFQPAHGEDADMEVTKLAVRRLADLMSNRF